MNTKKYNKNIIFLGVFIFMIFSKIVFGDNDNLNNIGIDSIQGVKIVSDNTTQSSIQQKNLVNKKEQKQNKNIADFRVYVDKSTITIGEKIQYTMEIDVEKGAIIEFPYQGSNFGGFVVKDFFREKTKNIGNKIKEKQCYVLDTYTTGSYVIPEQIINIKLSNGKTYELKSSKIFVEVKSVINDKDKEIGLKDIKSVLDVPIKVKGLIIVILIVLFLMIFLVVGILCYRKFFIKKDIVEILPAHEIALIELGRIDSMDLIRLNKVKEYYYLVSECIRTYLENRFNIKAKEKTTEEFLEFITKPGSDVLETKYVNILKEYLAHCDLVKYAKLNPEKSQVENLLKTTKEFINETKIEQEEIINKEEEK